MTTMENDIYHKNHNIRPTRGLFLIRSLPYFMCKIYIKYIKIDSCYQNIGYLKNTINLILKFHNIKLRKTKYRVQGVEK